MYLLFALYTVSRGSEAAGRRPLWQQRQPLWLLPQHINVEAEREQANSNVIVNRERVKSILEIDLNDLLNNAYCIKRVREQESLY